MLDLISIACNLWMYRLTDMLDLISIACNLYTSNSENSHRIFGTF